MHSPLRKRAHMRPHGSKGTTGGYPNIAAGPLLPGELRTRRQQRRSKETPRCRCASSGVISSHPWGGGRGMLGACCSTPLKDDASLGASLLQHETNAELRNSRGCDGFERCRLAAPDRTQPCSMCSWSISHPFLLFLPCHPSIPSLPHLPNHESLLRIFSTVPLMSGDRDSTTWQGGKRKRQKVIE